MAASRLPRHLAVGHGSCSTRDESPPRPCCLRRAARRSGSEARSCSALGRSTPVHTRSPFAYPRPRPSSRPAQLPSVKLPGSRRQSSRLTDAPSSSRSGGHTRGQAMPADNQRARAQDSARGGCGRGHKILLAGAGTGHLYPRAFFLLPSLGGWGLGRMRQQFTASIRLLDWVVLMEMVVEDEACHRCSFRCAQQHGLG